MKRLLILLLLSTAAVAQVTVVGAGGTGVTITTVAALGTPAKGTISTVTDGSTATDCTVGGGTTAVTCLYSGTAWAAVASAGTGTVSANNSSNAHACTVYTSNAGSTTVQADTGCYSDGAGNFHFAGLTIDGTAATGYTSQADPAITTVASLGTATNGLNKIITDGSTTSDCTVGGGTNKNWCQGNGSAWIYKLPATYAYWLSSTASPAEWRYYNGTAIQSILSTENLTTARLPATSNIRSIGCGMGSPTSSTALTTSETCYVVVPYACTIAGWNILVDAGTATVKTWRVATGTAIPTVSNSISTSGVSISTGTAVHSTTVTDFTSTAIAANDIVAFNLSAVATAKFVYFSLQCNQ